MLMPQYLFDKQIHSTIGRIGNTLLDWPTGTTQGSIQGTHGKA
jgi:hypothetical protein